MTTTKGSMAKSTPVYLSDSARPSMITQSTNKMAHAFTWADRCQARPPGHSRASRALAAQRDRKRISFSVYLDLELFAGVVPKWVSRLAELVSWMGREVSSLFLLVVFLGQQGPACKHEEVLPGHAAAVAMPAIPVIVGLADAETACWPGCHFYRTAAVIVDVPCCRAAPSPSGRHGYTGHSAQSPLAQGNGRSHGIWLPPSRWLQAMSSFKIIVRADWQQYFYIRLPLSINSLIHLQTLCSTWEAITLLSASMICIKNPEQQSILLVVSVWPIH